MANAKKWAPQLLNTPHFEGQVVVFRSPHSRQVMLVDVAEEIRGRLSYTAALSESVTKTAINAYRMMGNKMDGDFERGFFSFTQCQHFCANHAVHNMNSQNSLHSVTDSVDWVANTVSLPHEQAVARLLDANLLPPSHNIAMTQELVGRIVMEQQGPSPLPGFLLDAYNGRVDAQNYDTELARMIIEHPALIKIFASLPSVTVDVLREFVEEAPVDESSRFYQDHGFIRAGDHRPTVQASLDGFLNGSGLGAEIVQASLYQEQSGDYETLFINRLMTPEDLAKMAAYYQVDTVEVTMTPEGNAPALVSSATSETPYVLMIDLIDGQYPTPETFERVVQRAELDCDPEVFNEIGMADHTEAPAMRMG